MTYTKNEIKGILLNKLSKSRYEHTLGVCETAIALAKQFGEDEDKAYLAALLHDCAKYMSAKEQIEYANNNGIKLSEEELLCPPVIHAPLGAEIARIEYGVEDGDVLDAIRYHTVAKENMSVLEKIIYTADMIEPNRKFDGVEELRNLASMSLDKVFKACLKASLMFNITDNKRVHPNSLKCWNDIIQKGN